MVDITHKLNTLREATALAVVKLGAKETLLKIENNQIPKGDIYQMSKAAGLLAVKKTPELLPDCHPIPVEYAGVTYEVKGLEIHISMTVKTIYKTGVEVEAMHGASVVALNMYDMLKPVDQNITIGTIKLLKKKGGKSSVPANGHDLTCTVVVCSDSVSKGLKDDKSGRLIKEKMESFGVKTAVKVIPDEEDYLLRTVEDHDSDLMIFTGGTGLGPRDITPETLKPLLDVRLDGVEEEMRRYGQQRMPFAMLSRSLAGIKNQQVILAFPGSPGGAADCVEAIFPQLFHVFHILKGGGH